MPILGKSQQMLAELQVPRRMDPAEFAAAMAPVEQHLRSLADDMCCPLLQLGRRLAITRDDFLAPAARCFARTVTEVRACLQVARSAAS